MAVNLCTRRKVSVDTHCVFASLVVLNSHRNQAPSYETTGTQCKLAFQVENSTTALVRQPRRCQAIPTRHTYHTHGKVTNTMPDTCAHCCWCAGLLVCWFVGLLVYWFAGLLVCWFVGLLVCWFVGLKLHHICCVCVQTNPTQPSQT